MPPTEYFSAYYGLYLGQAYGMFSPGLFPDTVTMPCGYRLRIDGPDDIPGDGESVPCPCGDKRHWIVYIAKEPHAAD